MKERTRQLDSLPQDVRLKLNELILRGEKPATIRATLMGQFGGQSVDLDALLTVHPKTYRRYIKLNIDRLRSALSPERPLIPILPPTTLAPTSNNPANVSVNKKEMLIDLFKTTEARRKVLEARQDILPFDPAFEAVIVQDSIEQRRIIESLVRLEDKLAVDADKEIERSFETFTEAFQEQVIETFKATHSDAKIEEFKADIAKRFAVALYHQKRKMTRQSS